jgi:hypothetical protein
MHLQAFDTNKLDFNPQQGTSNAGTIPQPPPITSSAHPTAEEGAEEEEGEGAAGQPLESAHGPRFGAGLIPETQVTDHQKFLPLKRPNMHKDPNWTAHCGTPTDAEDEAIIAIRCKHQKFVS